jgi:hypothetical protein
MKKSFTITVVVLLSSAMFLVGVCFAGDPVTKPFKAQWSGANYAVGPCVDPDPNLPPGAFQVLNVGKGVATITGESEFVSVSCSAFTSATFAVSSGWMILTAANGDKLHIRIEGTLDLATGVWTEKEWTVGGTGRFKNATGYSESEGKIIIPTAPDLFPFDANPAIKPELLAEPTYWVGKTDGHITY